MNSGRETDLSWICIDISFEPEFPIWTSDSCIVRLSCPRHNEFFTRADSSEISGVPTAHLCPSDEPRLLLSHRFPRHRYDPLPAAPDFAPIGLLPAPHQQ